MKPLGTTLQFLDALADHWMVGDLCENLEATLLKPKREDLK